MRSIRAEDHYLAEIDFRTEEGELINHSIEGPASVVWPRNHTERVVKYVYEEEFGVHVGEVDTKRTNCMDYALKEMPERARKCLRDLIRSHVEFKTRIENNPISVIEKQGIPDLFMYDESPCQFQFVEVKTDEGSIRDTQSNWLSDFKFMPASVVISFTSEGDRRKFLNELPKKGLDRLI